MSAWFINLEPDSDTVFTLDKPLEITNAALTDLISIGFTSLKIGSTTSPDNLFTVCSFTPGSAPLSVMLKVKLDKGVEYVLSAQGTNGISLIGYYAEARPVHTNKRRREDGEDNNTPENGDQPRPPKQHRGDEDGETSSGRNNGEGSSRAAPIQRGNRPVQTRARVGN
ncbi:hypothetical protein AAF712_010895 [Marasmius tenuissimus]|uniref:Nucleoplasmin-like domain-containing protein n=1 Tax=Marasmius tenuissimus TaxID=585030 RepID=A0ABR2ZLF8_9AGAR